MFSIIPISDAGIPIVKWSEYTERLPTEAEVHSWKQYTNRALVCGKISNVIAVDVDTDDAALIATIERQSGISPVRKFGTKGYTAFFKYNGEKSCVWQRDGKVVCELLSDKRLTTIPPSLHRITGKPYVWMESALGDVELPSLPPTFITIMDALFPKPQRAVYPVLQSYHEVRLPEAEDMMRYIDAGCSREQWVSIGMALRSEYGDTAYYLWHSWSATGGAKYNRRDADSAWRSFNGDGVTIGTLVYYAKDGGYMRVTEKPQRVAKKVAPPAPQPQASGLVRDIADWITSTAIRPQPKLSLAAAITFVAAMKGQRVKNSIRGARTNMLVMSLAPTGGGKDYPQEAIARLARECGLGKMMMGRPTSGTALLTGIHKAGGVSLLNIDEIGRYLQNITSKNSQNHQREIIDYMIELYSSSNRTFYGRQYANEKDNPQIILEQPHFCCLGSTVMEKFKDSCKSGDVIDGFLNRWLILKTEDRPRKDLTKKDYRPPAQLVDKIKIWLDNFPLKSDAYGVIQPHDIELTPEAYEAFTDFENQVEKKVDTTPHPLSELYARASEQVIKLATILTDDAWVGAGEIKSAISIVNDSISTVIYFASNIADNLHEENVIYVINAIKSIGGDVFKKDIIKKTRRLKPRERDEILSQLVEAGDLEVQRDGKAYIFSIPE